MSSLETIERAKYERVWGHEVYRRNAPGESLVARAVRELGMQAGDSLIDFGCGTGRPAQAFQDQGFEVTAVDFAGNCLDAGIEVRFVQACLWSLPDGLDADWGYCTDVMEHIPPERVDDTLRSIRAACRQGAFFQIATALDGFGPKLLGEPLHLTVRPPEWWRAALGRHWRQVAVSAASHGCVAVCR